MTKTRHLLTSVLLSLPFSVYSQTDDAISLATRTFNLCYEDPVLGSASYSGMAGAKHSLGRDLSSTRENPAGLGLYTHKNEVGVTPDLNIGSNGANGNISNFGGAFVLGCNHNAEGYVSSSLGFTYHRTRNFENKVNFGNGAFEEGNRAGLWSVGYGMNFGYRYFYGLGVNIIRDHYTQGTTNNGDYNEFDTRALGWNIKLGTILKIREQFNVSVAVHSPTRLNIEESAKLNKYDERGHVTGNNDYDNAEYHLWGPLKLEGGLGWFIGRNTCLDFEYAYQDFTAINVANKYDYYNDVKAFFEENMNHCHTIKMGVETEPYEKLKARAGFACSTNAITKLSEEELKEKDIHYAVQIPHESLYFTLGAGYSYKFLYADIAYVFKHQNTDFYKQITKDCYKPVEKSNNTSDILLTLGTRF